jgi:hypothetical protein
MNRLLSLSFAFAGGADGAALRSRERKCLSGSQSLALCHLRSCAFAGGVDGAALHSRERKCLSGSQSLALCHLRSFALRFIVGASLVVGVVGSAGCFDLDSFVWNPKHCSTTTDELCETKEMCAKCGDPLDFEKWGVAQSRVTQHPIDLGDGETNDSWFIASEGGPLSDVTIVFSHGNFGGIVTCFGL